MQACPGCGLSLDDAVGFCPTCGWRPSVEVRDAGDALSVPAGPLQQAGRPPTLARRAARIVAILWSAPRRLAFVPLVAILLAAHVAFPNLPWSRHAVRFGDTYDTGGLRLLAAFAVLLAGVGLWALIAWLLRRAR